jgi:hypothetical protein
VAKLAAKSHTKPITEHFPLLRKKSRRRCSPKDILPETTNFRNTKLTNYITVTHPPSRPRPLPQASLERRPQLRQRRLHQLWPDPFG